MFFRGFCKPETETPGTKVQPELGEMTRGPRNQLGASGRETTRNHRVSSHKAFKPSRAIRVHIYYNVYI